MFSLSTYQNLQTTGMSDFNTKVPTPTGTGYTFGKMPDGKIVVSHAWKNLIKTLRNNFKGTRTAFVIRTSKKEESHAN